MLIFSLFLGIISEPLLAVGFVSVSNGVNISPSSATLGKNFSIDFSLKETKGEAKTFDDISIAILDPTGKFIFDFKLYGKVTINANTTKAFTATNIITSGRPAGTYKAVIRGKYASSWFDFNAVGSGVTPKAFAVVAANQPPPPPPPPAIPLAPTLKTPVDNPTNKLPKTGVSFSWDASARATSYRLVISQNSSFSGFNPTTFACDGTCGTTTTTGTSLTRDLLLDATTYYWKVNASNATGTSPWSLPRSFATAGQAQLPDFKYITPVYDAKPKTHPTYCFPQCVEFVKINLNLPAGRTYAKEYWTNPHTGYTNYPQGSSKAPKPGDIMVWGGGLNPNMNICKDVNGCGHVAIIKSVNLNTGILIRVDANWNGKCAVIEHTMSVTKNSSGKYTIGGTDSNYLLGWQSKS